MRLCQVAVLMLWAMLTSAQTTTHEEQVVRTTYAKLSYADEIGIIVSAMSNADKWKVPEESLDKALNSRLDFQLSNFKTGDVKEIEGRIVSEISGGPKKATDLVLAVTPSTFNYHNQSPGLDEPPSWTLYAQIKWKELGYDPNRGGELWPMAEILKLPEMGGTFTRYATYTVTLTFQSKSITYSTLALFETKPDGSENVHFMDVHSGISMLDLLARSTIFPTPFIKTHLRNVPVVRRWLTANVQSCVGRSKKDGDVCCDPVSGRCGLEQHELPSFAPGIAKPMSYRIMRGRPRLVTASYHPPAALLVTGQVACTKFNASPSFPSIPSDTRDHALDSSGQPIGGHSFFLTASGTCTYSEGGVSPGPCNVQCDINADPSWGEIGTTAGFLPNFHVGDTVTNHGQAFSTGGQASCESHPAGSIVSCLTQRCAVGISINATKDGIGTVITFPTVNVYSNRNDSRIDCVAKSSTAAPSPTPIPPSPTPTPTPPSSCLTSQSCPVGGKPVPPCSPPTGGSGGDDPDLLNGGSNPCSPIIVDLTGEGFNLTDAAHGVLFDIANTGIPMQIAWTANSNNAFLVLDRDGSGTITSGAELFGNFTPQPSSPSPNGFLALAVYDDPMNGGNGDGIIDARDEIFSKLRLWVDVNHDGVCQPGELHLLPDLGVYALN
jgi:hypothetical protein